MSRRFIDASAEQRCQWTIKLRDGSEAQCGRRHVDGTLCVQHSKMNARWSCEYCGGNDELPPDHCADCERPLSSQQREPQEAAERPVSAYRREAVETIKALGYQWADGKWSAPQEAGKVEPVADERDWQAFCRPYVYMNGSHEMPDYAAICRAVLALVSTDAPVAELSSHVSERPYSEGKEIFGVVVLDRERCYDGAKLYLRPSQQASGDAKDARRYRRLKLMLTRRMTPATSGWRIVETCPTFGDEKDVYDWEQRIDAAILAAAGGSEK